MIHTTFFLNAKLAHRLTTPTVLPSKRSKSFKAKLKARRSIAAKVHLGVRIDELGRPKTTSAPRDIPPKSHQADDASAMPSRMRRLDDDECSKNR